MKINSNCWICEGWTEVKFEYRTGIDDDSLFLEKDTKVFLHLECDNFEKDEMKKSEEE